MVGRGVGYIQENPSQEGSAGHPTERSGQVDQKMVKRQQMKLLQKSGVRYFGERKGTNVSNNNALLELEELAGYQDTTTPKSGMGSPVRDRTRADAKPYKEEYKIAEDDELLQKMSRNATYSNLHLINGK